MADEQDIITEKPVERPDSVGRALMILALLLLVAVVGVGAGMVFYLRDGFELPRSAAERDIAAYTVAVQENPDEQANHLLLAQAYAKGGRAELALESVTLARQIDDNATVDLTEADVLRLNGDYGEALVLYERAESGALEAYAQAEEEMRKTGIAFPIDRTVFVRATNGQALVLWELDKREEAIEAIEKAVDAAPDDASLYVLLGTYLAETGDEPGAQEAYFAALRFVPDYPPALQGLVDLGVTANE